MTSRRFTLEDLQRKGFSVDGNRAAKGNKIGAVAQKIDGIRYGSKLELYMYNLLSATKIPFEFQVDYELLPGFTYLSQKIQPIKIVVDFFLKEHDLIVDTKGMNLYHTKIKLKMLKHRFKCEGKSTRIELPSTKEECEALINKLLKLKI